MTTTATQDPQNSAAWLMGPKVRPLKVQPAVYTPAGPGEIVVRNRAVAINPVDRMKQEMGDLMYDWVKYSAVQGVDLAGDVVEIGRNVTSFKVGDRVLGMGLGMEKEVNSPSGGAFQLYTVVKEQVATKIPDSMSFVDAATLPLALATATAGLFQEDQLDLQHPSSNPSPTGQTLLVWGASTSVGCNAVQLAVAAGYEVIAVCGTHNFDLVKRLGATLTFDYRSRTIHHDLIEAFETRTSAGCISCGNGGPEAALEVFAKVKGSKKVAFAAFPLPNPMPKRFVKPRFIWHMAKWFSWFMFWATLRGIKQSNIWASTPAFNGLGKTIFGDFLQQALARGTYIAAPEAKIVGHGLEFVQEAFDEHAKSVSAKKLVVTL